MFPFALEPAREILSKIESKLVNGHISAEIHCAVVVKRAARLIEMKSRLGRSCDCHAYLSVNVYVAEWCCTIQTVTLER